ncbi:hypothetical protein [Klebsiella oxytoca]|uniref:hypothetical protein n=1 Tax=Klebsiella oxytoca TaxID=571 RepID=UPI0029304AD0|nr:hypothetical protein [Klebsiella oxytoca]
MNTRISNLALGKMRKDAERMLALRSPAVDEEWWERMLSIVTELQERRNAKKDCEPVARMVVIPTIWKHYTAAKIATIYEKAMADAGIEWRSIDD